MGLTRADAERIGLGHLYPDAKSDAAILRERFGIDAERSRAVREDLDLSRLPQDRMTKLERSFADRLELAKHFGLIDRWAYEPWKFRLAGRCHYTPDFGVHTPGWGRNWKAFIETKGPFAREDSIIKLKVAAVKYPEYDWYFARRYGRHEWDVRRVDERGIGTSPVVVPWLIGV